MMKRAVRTVLMMFVASLLFACMGEKLELQVKARMDGQPAAEAKVTVDNEAQGLTGADGIFSKIIEKKPGVEVEVIVSKEMPGYRIKPWKATFVMKLPKSGKVDTYAFDADLEATRYVTITATEKGALVADAIVKASGKEMGKTDGQGVFVYEYKTLPKSGADLTVTKSGYATWRKTGQLEPGQKLEAALSKRVMVTISTLMEEYGQSSRIPGIPVNINNKEVGKTDAKGNLIYTYDGESGKKVPLTLSATGYMPNLEEIDRPGRQGLYPALFLFHHPQTDSYRDLPVREQYTERRLERGAQPDRGIGGCTTLQVHLLPRGALRNAPGRYEGGKIKY